MQLLGEKGRIINVEIWTNHIDGGNRELFGALVVDIRFHFVIPKVRKSEIKGHAARACVGLPNVCVCQVLNLERVFRLQNLGVGPTNRRTTEPSDYRTFGIESSHLCETSIKYKLTDAVWHGKKQSSTSFQVRAFGISEARVAAPCSTISQ